MELINQGVNRMLTDVRFKSLISIAAKNILAVRPAALACGENALLGLSMKQELIEVAQVWV